MYTDKLQEVKQKDGSVERFVDSVEECMSVLRQYEQCRIKLSGGPVPNADWGPLPSPPL